MKAFTPGIIVKINNCKDIPEFNGLSGRVVFYDELIDSYLIELEKQVEFRSGIELITVGSILVRSECVSKLTRDVEYAK